ncbi:MFS transporter [Rhodococcus sp. NPDC058521]|uniref:MFS transporter n=1 Tax=Rhodococcus sp. NPDC058521 TaxID=3346536 RepID=UPI003654F41A
MRKYSRLWHLPGAPMLIIGGTAARIGHGVTIIAWLLLIREIDGNYATAGLVSGAISLATAFAAPVAGRLVDRYAAARIVPVYAVGYSLAQAALLIAVLQDAGVSLLLPLAVLTGALFPPMSPTLRSAWSHVTRPEGEHSALRTTAMAAESAVFELVFVLGPLIMSMFIVLADYTTTDPTVYGAGAAITFATVTTLVGTIVVCRGRLIQSLGTEVASDKTIGVGPLGFPAFLLLLTVTAGVAFSFGASPVAIAAFATAGGEVSGGVTAGVLIAVWSVGSAAGGVVYGALPLPLADTAGTLTKRLLVLLVGLTIGYAAWNIAGSSIQLSVVLVATGAVIAPAVTVLAELVASTVPASMITESYTWFTCVNMSLAAAGAAVAGPVVDGPNGPALGFWLCAAATAAAIVAAAATGALTVKRAAVSA